jgi:serine/threonine protein phosphatase 1
VITRLLDKLKKRPATGTAPCIPEGQRVYCIGDIHGSVGLLERLHGMILEDAEGFEGTRHVVYLGDYVDRGEHTKQVLDLLLEAPLPGFEPVYLQGNHEQIMLAFIEYPEMTASWLNFGGREALNSYGIRLAHVPSRHEVFELSRRLDRALPDSHREFLQNGLEHWQCGGYYFVHAGIRPGVALEHQLQEDKLWIRDEFLDSRKDHGAIVVHGHSIVQEPDFQPNRIGIDTGAFRSGVLTCLVLEGDQQRILQTGIA